MGGWEFLGHAPSYAASWGEKAGWQVFMPHASLKANTEKCKLFFNSNLQVWQCLELNVLFLDSALETTRFLTTAQNVCFI